MAPYQYCWQGLVRNASRLTWLVHLSLLAIRRVRWRILAILTHLTIALLVNHARLLLAGIRAWHFTALSRLITNWRQLGPRPGLVVWPLSSLSLVGLAINLTGGSLGAVPLFLPLAFLLFGLLACFPFLADFFELYC